MQAMLWTEEITDVGEPKYICVCIEKIDVYDIFTELSLLFYLSMDKSQTCVNMRAYTSIEWVKRKGKWWWHIARLQLVEGPTTQRRWVEWRVCGEFEIRQQTGKHPS